MLLYYAERSLPPGRHFDWDPLRPLTNDIPLLDGVYHNRDTHERVVVSQGHLRTEKRDEVDTQDTDGSLWDNLNQPDSQDLQDYQEYKRIRNEY